MSLEIKRPCAICGAETSEKGGYFLSGFCTCSAKCRNLFYMSCNGCKNEREAEEAYKRDAAEDDMNFYYTDWA